MTNSTVGIKRIVRVSSVSLLVAAVAFLPSVTPQAQKSKEPPPKVTGIHSRKTASGEVITLSTDKPLRGTQTWQDPDGKFHLIVPGAGDSSVSGAPNGVKVRRVGNSLEIEVPAQPGANVTVQPGSNRLDLVVKGGVRPSQSEPDEKPSTQASNAPVNNGVSATNNAQARTPRNAAERRNAMSAALAATKQPESLTDASATADASQQSAAKSAQQSANTQPVVPSQASDSPPVNADAAPATQTAAPPPPVAPPPPPPVEEGSLSSYLFSMTGLSILLTLALLVGFLLLRRRRRASENLEEDKWDDASDLTATAVYDSGDKEEERRTEERTGERRKRSWGRRGSDQQTSMVKATSTAAVAQPADSKEKTLDAHPSAPAVPALFGAYRVDQEIGKLILGQPHRMDVLASRAPDDRRAMETSLIKTMSAPETDEDCRRRARQALEEYGFVARQSATLLLAHDDYERASAARTLGEIGSTSALPFLLEALYDADATVRTQAVASLGALKMPAAIGALLDMARRYPEMPASLLSQVLSDCSIECLDVFGTSMPERAFLAMGSGEPFSGEIMQFEPSTTVEDLPEWMEDEALEEALARLQDQDVEARTAAAQQLAQFQVQRSVAALTMLASQDTEAAVRGAAVTSLGAIDHESVFAPVLIAFADEAREVRAAAARSLSRLNFDRADAYVRVMETAGADTLREVACACIKAGMASQAIDRLASEDRRQAYEAFSLLSLLAKSNQVGPILEAIDHHGDLDVRLAAVRLLGLAGQPEIVPQLRQLTVRDGVPEKVRMTLLEVVYKMDQQTQPV
jgi:HEAT repeat protein